MEYNVIDIKRVTIFGHTKDLDQVQWEEFKEMCRGFVEYENEPKPVKIDVSPIELETYVDERINDVKNDLQALREDLMEMVNTSQAGAINTPTPTAEKVEAIAKVEETMRKVERVKAKKRMGRRGTDLSDYIRMHEMGKGKDVIKRAMIDDGIPSGSIHSHWEDIIKATSKVTVIDPSAGLTDEERIERLIAQNKAEVEARKKPKI